MIKLRNNEFRSGPMGVALRLSPPNFISDIRNRLAGAGVVDAVQQRQTEPIFDWMMGLLALQGISDRAAESWHQSHGVITWADVQRGLRSTTCPRLLSWWHYSGCGYQKSTQSCAEPQTILTCSLPRHDVRKGVLAQAAYAFALFVRDICNGDFVEWIDQRLALADASTSADRGQQMSLALIRPLTEIPGSGPKIWSMVLADLLLGADPTRERWLAAGASMVVIDSLTHNFLHRTGTLQRHHADHAYGPRCYLPGGCADVIRRIAAEIDARAFDPDLPSFCPRFVQHALWYFCAEGGWNVCNGRQIDDRHACAQTFCPAGPFCARLSMSR